MPHRVSGQPRLAREPGQLGKETVGRDASARDPRGHAPDSLVGLRNGRAPCGWTDGLAYNPLSRPRTGRSPRIPSHGTKHRTAPAPRTFPFLAANHPSDPALPSATTAPPPFPRFPLPSPRRAAGGRIGRLVCSVASPPPSAARYAAPATWLGRSSLEESFAQRRLPVPSVDRALPARPSRDRSPVPSSAGTGRRLRRGRLCRY